MKKLNTANHIDFLLTKILSTSFSSLPVFNTLAKLPHGCIIVNALPKGLDELLLIKELDNAGVSFKFFSINPRFIDDTALKNFYHSPFHLQFQNLNLPPSSKAIRVALKNVLSNHTHCVISLNFSPSPYEAVHRRQLNRKILREVKKLQVPITPLCLKLPATAEENTPVLIRKGTPITPAEQKPFKKIKKFYRYIQARINALGWPIEVDPFFTNAPNNNEDFQKIAEPINQLLIENEIINLPTENFLSSRAQFDTFVAKAEQIPHSLKEIGRLRETAFRNVGEGSGKAVDLDEFDLYYHQLIIWDRINKKIAGGYRIAKGDEIFEKLGVEGLYIFSLFKIKSGLFPLIKKSIELGRSFVTPEYQKQRLPLFLLWKGILHFLLQNPSYEYIYGPLSISKYYSDISKGLMVKFFSRYYFDKVLSKFVKPRNPYTSKSSKQDLDILIDSMGKQVNRLDNFIEEIEIANFKMPVLLKQYIKQNAKFIAFNIDPQFSDVLDGFMILNVKDLPPSTIEALKEEITPKENND